MKKVAIALALLLAFAPLGMAYFSPDDSDSVSNSITTTSSVNAAALYLVPAASTAIASGATAGTIKVINDAEAAGRCDAAVASSGGTTQVVCVSNGTSWLAI